LASATSAVVSQDGESKDEESTEDTSVATLERIKSLGVDKWNQLIYANALEGNAKNAEQVLKLMEEVGVEPDLESFGHLVEAYANAGNLEKAQKTMDMMLNSKSVVGKLYRG